MSIQRGMLNTTGMLLLAVAVFYSLRYWPEQLPLLPAAPAAHSDTPDYTITDFHALDLDENGRLRYELVAEQLVHFAVPEHAELTAPDMVFYRNGVPGSPLATDPWQLTANTGLITGSGQRLDLAGEVKVTRLVADGVDRMTMESSALTVLGDQEFATTDGPFTLRSAQAELTGVGMKIDMKHGRMHLLSQVRGRYDPP